MSVDAGDDLMGLWVSIDQGDAETIYRFVADGTYDQVSILMQARPSGTFSFIIQSTGLVQLDGERMLLTPTARATRPWRIPIRRAATSTGLSTP